MCYIFYDVLVGVPYKSILKCGLSVKVVRHVNKTV